MVALKRRKGYILKLARNPTLPDHDHSILRKTSAKMVGFMTSWR